MRIRVRHRPVKPTIDGIRLTQFEPGRVYELGYTLAALFIAEGWGKPDDTLGSDTFPDMTALPRQPYRDPDDPRNLIREYYPPSLDKRRGIAADFVRRRRSPRRR